ncbi:MAG TPA: hypothetical protein PKL15_17385 [Saprospiraceae bacterium]|nr:hypothetical protein [Saprospiraceae bacterium]HNL37771.1 hypothetical protein [Saprospiraceae bacterium]HNM27222.1 hypothetical protein [Saprospiraceae bacterium]
MRILACFSLFLLLSACGGASAPIDADTRSRIDSIANAQIREARIQIDSQCALRERNDLPRLIDSFKQVRMREIQEQLKTIPK